MKKIISVFGMLVFLTLAVKTQAQTDKEKDALSATGDFQSFSDGAQAKFNSSSMPSFQYKESTKGSQYLFNNWVSGIVTNKEGVQFSEGYVFNYDKMTQNLYMKVKDTAKAILVDKDQLQAITLKGDNRVESFEKVPSISKDYFYNVLVKGNKYSLYRLTKTKFIPSNYETNGLTSSGNLYDEFKEEYKYYIVYPNGTNKEFSTIKPKAIKTLFADEKTKLDTFFKEHQDMDVDEKFLQLLVEYLN